MTPAPTCCQPDHTVEEAAEMMKREDVGMIPVVGDQANLVGVITDRDIVVKAIAEGRDARQTMVSEIMTRNPVACRIEEPADTILTLMASRQIRRIPIVGDDGAVIGIIAQADVAIRPASAEQTGEVVEAISEPEHAAAP